MRYSNGKLAKLGDRVRLGDREGTVVFSIDTDEFSHAYPRESWAYLGRGIMIEVRDIGLIHYTDSEADLQFIARAFEA